MIKGCIKFASEPNFDPCAKMLNSLNIFGIMPIPLKLIGVHFDPHE
jgi:hypothetical protein